MYYGACEESFTFVTVRRYDPDSSSVEVNPVRLRADLHFPEQGGGRFKLDLELAGVRIG